MDNQQLHNKIKELGPWYQNVDLYDSVSIKSSHSKYSGEWAWNYLKEFLPEDMSGMRVLDLGSNAGLFSIRCAQRGAQVIGVENNNGHLRQANFLKEYFEVDNVRFVKANIENIPMMDLGFVDYDIILAVAVLYWVGRIDKPHYCEANRNREIKFIKQMSTQSDEFIVRCRGTEFNNHIYYSGIFENLGYDTIEVVFEEGVKNSHQWINFVRM